MIGHIDPNRRQQTCVKEAARITTAILHDVSIKHAHSILDILDKCNTSIAEFTSLAERNGDFVTCQCNDCVSERVLEALT